jgi:hypothetical protein
MRVYQRLAARDMNLTTPKLRQIPRDLPEQSSRKFS